MIWGMRDRTREFLTDFVGWTLVYSTWQGVILVLIAAALCRYFCRRAETRYLICCAILILLPLSPIGTALLLKTDVLTRTTRTAPQQVSTTEPVQPIPQQPVAPTIRDVFETRSMSGDFNQIYVPVDEPVEPPLPAWLTWIVGTWFAGMTVVGLHALMGLVGCWRLRLFGTAAVSDEWQKRILRLARRMHLRVAPSVLLTHAVKSPLVMGVIKPVILVPVCLMTELSPRQIELILLHELAHIRRYDLLMNSLQVMIETIMFFHPGVWWLSRQIRRERELCCDALVIATGERNVDYAEALISFASQAGPRLATGASGGILHDRIAYLLRSDTPVQPMAQRTRRGPSQWLIIAGLLLMLIAGIWILYGPAISDHITRWRMHDLINNPMPDPDRAVVIDWHVPWASTDWGGKRNTNIAAFMPTDQSLRLSVGKQGACHVWTRELDEPIDTTKFSKLVMRYRYTTKAVDPSLGTSYVLWVDDGTGPMGGGASLIMHRDIVADGRDHVLVKDLSTHELQGPVNRLALKVIGMGVSTSELEIADLRFISAGERVTHASDIGSSSKLSVQVVDPEGSPISNAIVRTSAGRRNAAKQYKTDAAGLATVRLTPTQSRYLHVAAQGHVSVRVGPVDPTDTPIKVWLPQTESYSGSVQDENGRPIAHATVELIVTGLTIRENQSPAVRAQLLTDDQGRFRCSHLAGGDVTVLGYASHADYLPAVFQASSQAGREASVVSQVALSDLESGRVTLWLAKGVEVDGVLTLAEGTPASYLISLESKSGMVYGPPVRSNDEGEFKLPPAPVGEAVLTLSKGAEMICATINIQPSVSLFRIDLDEMRSRNISLKVIGEVLDARTRQPIPAFVVTRAHQHQMDFRGANGTIHWEKNTREECTEGKFEVAAVSSKLPTLVKVEAPGYRTAVSRAYLKHEGEQVWQGLLKRAE